MEVSGRGLVWVGDQGREGKEHIDLGLVYMGEYGWRRVAVAVGEWVWVNVSGRGCGWVGEHGGEWKDHIV